MKIFLAFISTFCKFGLQIRTKRQKKTENLFNECVLEFNYAIRVCITDLQRNYLSRDNSFKYVKRLKSLYPIVQSDLTTVFCAVAKASLFLFSTFSVKWNNTWRLNLSIYGLYRKDYYVLIYTLSFPEVHSHSQSSRGNKSAMAPWLCVAKCTF